MEFILKRYVQQVYACTDLESIYTYIQNVSEFIQGHTLCITVYKKDQNRNVFTIYLDWYLLLLNKIKIKYAKLYLQQFFCWEITQ